VTDMSSIPEPQTVPPSYITEIVAARIAELTEREHTDGAALSVALAPGSAGALEQVAYAPDPSGVDSRLAETYPWSFEELQADRLNASTTAI
jgi:hypothetical protein